MGDFKMGTRSGHQMPGVWDEAALAVARRFTDDNMWRTRAALQCAVLDAMEYGVNNRPPVRNRAAEWGRYLATSVDRLLNAINDYHEAEQAVEEAEDKAAEDIAENVFQQARESLSEYMTGARSSAYEFRRRVDQDEREAELVPGSLAALQAENKALRGALEHIERTASRSREQSRRVRWIELRANGALTGSTEWRTLDLPKNGDASKRRAKFDREQAEYWQARCEQLEVAVNPLRLNTYTSPAVVAILAERVRQVAVEGFTDEQDDKHIKGALAAAAACYALRTAGWHRDAEIHWPWENDWWKPTTPRRNLEKAGALIIAELDRVIRSERPAPVGSMRLARVPFDNCQFRECDLPGQCHGEGACHHPKARA
ncbi:hypothetical protein M0D69_13740 [Caballeronia sp. SEWSISQ10-4 2]|uniref:hypothetical protein n=1 Tax=Caballeronia sp. SEWSISQ10-4 2 TaxID=2937438 RepID=UPI002650C387|nr:hypothetical protein [Caballeronia sp. SEWSISQ10-4 2]MDN7179055.1 hypothetical protein [Caballeronia sp. SEWSISQ10-4 2]